MRQKHFSIEERESLFKFLIQGLSVSEISKKLEKHRSSIYRELKRNDMNRKNYSPSKANENYKVRKKQCGRNSKIIKNSFLAIFIEALIKKKYTPEQIWGQYKKGVKVCFKTVYRAIEMNGSRDPFFIINRMKSNTENLFCFIELLIVDGLEFRLSFLIIRILSFKLLIQ